MNTTREPRVMPADSAHAIGRFNPNGIDGYKAATMPDAPLRQTRIEAVEDERAYLESTRECRDCRKRFAYSSDADRCPNCIEVKS